MQIIIDWPRFEPLPVKVTLTEDKPPYRLTPAEDEIVLELYRKGETLERIAKVLGRKNWTINHAVERIVPREERRPHGWHWRNTRQKRAEWTPEPGTDV